MNTKVCPSCGGPTIQLFSSHACKRECDLKGRQGVVVGKEHRMDLGDGWLHWARDEKPPFGWTHVRAKYKEVDGSIKEVTRDRPDVERLAQTFAYSPNIFVVRAVAGRVVGASHYDWAYKVPA